MRHVRSAQLALYARGDLGFWSRLRTKSHLDRCEECLRSVDEFANLRESLLPEHAQLPGELTGGAWEALASEMTANIRLGISAGECVATGARAGREWRVERPRWAFALAGMALLVLFAMLQHPDGSKVDDGWGTLEASGSGIAVRSAGRMLAVRAPKGVDVIRTVNTGGEIRSRYVDDTGVTIVNVYAE